MTCKGSMSLGTGCGECFKCQQEIQGINDECQKEMQGIRPDQKQAFPTTPVGILTMPMTAESRMGKRGLLVES
jgi:hypothetical protein